MKQILSILTILLLCTAAGAQQQKTVGIRYDTIDPVAAPTRQGSEYHINVSTGIEWRWHPDSLEWVVAGARIQKTELPGIPNWTPGGPLGPLAINAGDSIYHYHHGAWHIASGAVPDLSGYATISQQNDSIAALRQAILDSLAMLPDSILTGYGVAGYLPYYTGVSTFGTTALYWDGSKLGIGTVSPTSQLEVRGLAKFLNATATADNADFPAVDINNFSLTGRVGFLDKLYGQRIKGTLTFNTLNQVGYGLNIDLTTNATTSHGLRPLAVNTSANMVAASVIQNSSMGASAGHELQVIRGLEGQTGQTIAVSAKSTNAFRSVGVFLQDFENTNYWAVGTANSEYLRFFHNNASSAVGAVNPTMWIQNKRIGMGQYDAFAPQATLHIKGEGTTLSTSSFRSDDATGAPIFSILDNKVLLIHGGGHIGDFTTPALQFGSASSGLYLDNSRVFFKAGGAFAGGFASNGLQGNAVQVITNTAGNNLTEPRFIPYRLTAAGLDAGMGGNSSGDISLITSDISRIAIKASGNIGFGTETPVASAIVDITSTTQGFLPPRFTTTQRDAIVSPATGLMLFCTDCTATDGSTGVSQTYSSSAWRNHY